MKKQLHPHALSYSLVLKKLKTSKKGLTASEAKKRLKQHGANILSQNTKYKNWSSLLISQFYSPLIIILLIAGSASGALREFIDMGIIFGTVVINVFVGFFQEFKANQAIQKIEALVEHYSIVIRNGKKLRVEASTLVPGDILYLEPGISVPADARLLSSDGIEINEAPLTGESTPIKKTIKKISADTQYADQKNMLFRGTRVINGIGLGVITATGQDTIIGGIADLISDVDDGLTPLQEQVLRLSKTIGFLIAIIAIGIFVIGLFTMGTDTHTVVQLFETAVAVSVAAIPEGLVISLTIILAIGMKFITKKKALVRKMVSAETLGSVDVICTDKTGTITEGNMQVNSFEIAGTSTKLQDITAELLEQVFDQPLATAIFAGALANTAVYDKKSDSYVGDTTDIAFAQLVHDLGSSKEMLDNTYKNKKILPFDSKNKFVASLHSIDKKDIIFMKGASEVLLERSSHIATETSIKKISDKDKDTYNKKVQQYAKQGYRVIALAYKSNGKDTDIKDASGLTFLGIAILSDPVRPNVASILKRTKAAGIRAIMITGDYPATARAIAQKIGLVHNDKNVLSGDEIEKLNDDQLFAIIEEVSVFARANPNHKIRIIHALKQAGHVVAMTGDGINDAPALKAADIGIAVGSGTDTAKQTADLILLDDSLETIVDAIEQGRGIYENIQKVILYLFSGTFAEVVMITSSLLLGLPLAALPAQILWVNVLEDTFPNIALAFDKGDPDNMKLPPRDPKARLITKDMRLMIIFKSILSNVFLLAIFISVYRLTNDIVLARTLVFIGFAVDSLFIIFSVRHMRYMIWERSLVSNPYVLGAVALGWILLVGAVELPILQLLLQTTSIGFGYWMLMLGFGVVNLVLMEIIKFFTTHNRIVKTHTYA